MLSKGLPIVAACALAFGSAAATAQGNVGWTRCTLKGAEGRTECAEITVPESRAGNSRRMIRLRIARLHPLDRGSPAPDPIVVLQGGPGQSAISLASFYGGEDWRTSRRRRAILLIDQRGTGGSNPLDCDLGGREGDPQSWLYEHFPDAPIRACREKLRKRAQLGEYTTENAVLDLEQVRRRLGYARLNLYGTSYGTRVALRYLERFPNRVRSLVLKGVVEPPAVIPESFPRDTERSINLILAACKADRACSRAYPTIEQDYRQMLLRLSLGPVIATVRGEKGGAHQVTLTEGVIVSSVRSALQATPHAVRVPSLIAAAAKGDFAPLAGLILAIRHAAVAVYTGMMLSVICAEDVPYLRAEAADAGTLLGSYWRDRTLAACGIWNVPADRARFRTMRSHDTPALLISGYFDPATPPYHAEAARKYLPNSAHLVARGGSHSFAGMQGCADVAIARFYDTANPQALDLSCGERVSLPSFAAKS